MFISRIIILCCVTTRIGLNALMLKKHVSFLMSSSFAALYSSSV